MKEFSTYEYVVTQKKEGKWRLARLGLLLIYTLYVLAWIIAGVITRILVPLLALIPVTTWMLIFFTWRYVSVEYEYSITSGVLTFTKIFGGRSRKKIFEVPLRQAVKIAPLSDKVAFAEGERYKPEREFIGVSSMAASDIWFMLFELDDRKNEEKRRAIYYFEATDKVLHLCRYYNKSATSDNI